MPEQEAENCAPDIAAENLRSYALILMCVQRGTVTGP